MPTHNPHDPNDPDFKLVHPASSRDFTTGNSEPANDFMHVHQGSDPESAKIGYETTDANVRDTAAFLVVMVASLAVVFVLAFGVGKLINLALTKKDGPANKWSELAGARVGGNFESDPQIEQQQLQQMVKRFPTPRLQTDDGNMDVAEMHAREDMLLNHYSWVDEQKQTVRIPITRAMELIAQRGLPVQAEPANEKEQAMFGDGSNAITAPLTDGFARTGPELKVIEAREQRLQRGESPNTQAELQPAR